MALTGVLGADFQSFFDAVQSAEVRLRSFEAGAGKVETALSRMTDNFSGRRIIQDATLMAEAIERAGGVTRLTAAELQKAGAVASEAGAKMRALGIDVPERLTKIATAAADAGKSVEKLGPAGTTGSSGVGDLNKSLSQFDGALSAVGIKIGPEIQGLKDLGAAAGKTATDLGALTTAGLAVAAFTGGWQIGRLVADWLDLDRTIGDATAALLGWGDVAAQEAGAGADVLALATKNAGREITNFSEALAINAAAVAEAQKRTVDWAGRMVAAQEAVAALTPMQITMIEGAQKLGATQQQLAIDFGVTADTLVLLRDRIKDADTVGRIWGAGMAGAAADLEALDAAARELHSQALEPLTGLLMNFDDSLARIDPHLEDWVNSLHDAATAIADEVAPALSALDVKIAETSLTFSQAMEAVRRGEGTMTATIQAPSDSAEARWRIMEAHRAGRYFGPVNSDGSPNYDAIFAKTPSFAAGVTDFQGGLAKVHGGEMLVNLAPGTDVVPAGRGGGAGGLTIIQNFGGMVGDTATLARVIKDALVQDYKNLGYRGPVHQGG